MDHLRIVIYEDELVRWSEEHTLLEAALDTGEFYLMKNHYQVTQVSCERHNKGSLYPICDRSRTIIHARKLIEVKLPCAG